MRPIDNHCFAAQMEQAFEVIVFSGAWAQSCDDLLLMNFFCAWRQNVRLALQRPFERLRVWLVALQQQHLALHARQVHDWYVFQ